MIAHITATTNATDMIIVAGSSNEVLRSLRQCGHLVAIGLTGSQQCGHNKCGVFSLFMQLL